MLKGRKIDNDGDDVGYERVRWMLQSYPLELLASAFGVAPALATVEVLFGVMKGASDETLVVVERLCRYVTGKDERKPAWSDIQPKLQRTSSTIVVRNCPRDYVLDVLGHADQQMDDHTYASLLHHTNVHALAVLHRAWEILGPKREVGEDGALADRLILDAARYTGNKVGFRAWGPGIAEQVEAAAQSAGK